MTDDLLAQFISRIDALINKLDDSQRKALARDISRHLRGSQAKRIRENKNPDGSDFAPRKPQPHLRSRQGNLRMFKKLHRAKHLKAKGTADSATVNFVGFASRIARVSQYGLRDKVNERGLQHQYEKRELLGLTATECEYIETKLADYLSFKK